MASLFFCLKLERLLRNLCVCLVVCFEESVVNIKQLVKNAIEIYQRLLAVGFLGDVSLYSLEEAMTAWEGEFVHEYLAEEVAAFSIKKT